MPIPSESIQRPHPAHSETADAPQEREAAITPSLAVLLGIAALAPLPLGSNRAWAWSGLAVLAGLALVLLFLESRGRRPLPVHPRRLIWEGSLLGLVVLWVLVQATSWTPPAWHHEFWQEAAVALGQPLAGRITVDLGATLDALTVLLTHVTLFFLAVQHGRSPARAGMILGVVVVVVSVYAGYGLIEYSLGNRHLLFWPKLHYQLDLTSTFVNRNSCATYFGLGLVVVLVLLPRAVLTGTGGLRPRLWLRQAMTNLAGRGGAVALAGATIAVALIFTHSRAGFFSAIMGCVATGGVLVVRRFTMGYAERKAWLLGLVGLGIMAFTIHGGVTLLHRYDQINESLSGRVPVYEAVVEMIRLRPWQGIGFGAFEAGFQPYRPHTLTAHYDQAHNDYLELAAELGLPATAIFLLMLVLPFGRCCRGALFRRQHHHFPLIAVGASLVAAIHAVLDFSLQIPAVAATYAILLGVGVAQSWGSRTDTAKARGADAHGKGPRRS